MVTMGMTLLQLAICLSNLSERIDVGNRDFQFSLIPCPALKEMWLATDLQINPDIFRENCLSRHILGLIADQWTPLVIYAQEETASLVQQREM